MALIKIGSLLKIAATGLALEDVVVEKAPAAEKKVIEPKNSEFLYFRARAISAGDQGPTKGSPNPNGNGDYFPRKELEASYETFRGRNLFLNHDSDHPIKSIGKILDSYSVEDPETGEYYIECLAKIDRKLHPEIARKIETGELNTVSMGCSCEASMCSVCGLVIHSDDDEKCDHLTPHGILKEHIAEVDLPEYGIKRGEPILAFSINSGLSFNELSIVNVPADSRAFIKGIIASNLKSKINKQASLDETERRHLQALLNTLDDETKQKIKADFCGCPVPKEEKKMSEKEMPTALSKMSALEYMEFANWMEKKLAKAAAPEATKVEEPVKVEEPIKVEEKPADSLVEKAISAVKNSPLGKLVSNAVKKEIEKSAKPEDKIASTDVRAVFTSNEDFGKSSWDLFKGDKRVLHVSASQLWDAEQLADEKYQKWTASTTYGEKLVATYNKLGFTKTAELLGLNFKSAEKAKHLKTETTVSKPEGSFVKPGKETKEDKAADKTQDALHKADETAVGEHLESSKPESEKKEADLKPEAASTLKEAVTMADPIEEIKVDEAKPAEIPADKPVDVPADAPAVDAPAADPMEMPQSAFDKLDDGIVIAEGMKATKDKEKNEIVITDASGSEVKRLPDGFGTDVPSVMKLLQSIIGVEHKEEAPKVEEAVPAVPEEEPKLEAPMKEEPMKEEPAKEEAMFASKKDELVKKAEELSKKEAELKKQEAEINAKKFTAAIGQRTEHCKKLVAAMLQKDMLRVEEADIEASIKEGLTLLDARAEALKKAVSKQIKALLAMDDTSLTSFEASISNVAIKKEASSKLTTPLHLGYSLPTDEDEIGGIFDTMGNGGGIK